MTRRHATVDSYLSQIVQSLDFFKKLEVSLSTLFGQLLAGLVSLTPVVCAALDPEHTEDRFHGESIGLEMPAMTWMPRLTCRYFGCSCQRRIKMDGSPEVGVHFQRARIDGA